jgi:hypothetical protein
MTCCGERELILAFEVAKEAAFDHPRFVADVIQRRRRVALRPDDMQGRIQKAEGLADP